MKVRYRASAGIAVLALAVAACGGGGGEAKKPSAEQSQQAQEQMSQTPAISINPVPYEQVKDGGTLTLAVGQWPTQWNGNHVDGNQADTADMLDPIMPELMVADEGAQWTPNPNYVTDVKNDMSSGKQVITYTLNEKAQWSDGTPITYKDLQAQWKANSGKDKKFKPASTDGWDKIESVEKGDSDKVAVITFTKPYPEWQGLFTRATAWLFPAKHMESAKAYEEDYLQKIPVTAGPFKVESINEGTKTLTLVRDDKWWGQKAKLDKIIFRGIESPEAQVNAFANGEIDGVEIPSGAPAELKRAKEVPNVDIRKALSPNWRHITVNNQSTNLKDKVVRQAIAYGINRDVITQSDLKDMDWPLQTLGNHVFMNNHKGYVDNSGDLGKYNLEKAKQLLDQAGWKQEGEYRKKDGKDLELAFVIPTGTPVSQSEGELVQAMLKEAGVKVNIRPVPVDKFFTDYIIKGDFDLVPFSWIGTPLPIGSLSQIYKTGSESNFPKGSDPALDAAIQAAVDEMDPAKAIELANAADKLIWDMVHTIPLYQRPDIQATKKTLANWGARGYKTLDYTAIGFTG
ncbi:putative monoacyl phosphatidylinositol tetramannoside-binding protein LpqW precursor [Nonomuraea coxensis DSM 45129]|uniref:Monoacyl phosphatidylinositol tetramannoside-binding protein LpqW n=1 Tax=Nonomuraea coxensis DSM 45129 TaxID=1122611 RepID=A0ABX8TWY8_9ACTN|nr:ABC transporter family substrate-binding protein [Nonomuraea coxensis]QYC40015.1 putative monoacyl phosphatidylinositol tetramannoside-binding protein LpqW precursor [Nonomuraea coxensis DSM 45129]